MYRLFLRGVEEEGKGQWKAISKKFVPTRTPAQIASHAQKFEKRPNSKTPPEKRRASINDIRSYSEPNYPLDSRGCQPADQPSLLLDIQNSQPNPFTSPFNFEENFPSDTFNFSSEFQSSQPNQLNFPLDSYNLEANQFGNATGYNHVHNNY